MSRAMPVVVFLFVIFTSIALPAQTFTTLYNFCSENPCPSGNDPIAPVIQGSDGNFYGTTSYGGTNYFGTVFKMTPEGVLTTLYTFCSQQNCADGEGAFAGLVQAKDGNFYGTTLEGGAYSAGTLYQITPSGTLTTLHTFNGLDGFEPEASLIQATDGNLYGTSTAGYLRGTIFKTTLQGELTVLHLFCINGCDDGAYPEGPLVQGADGSLYGTTAGGGTHFEGTVFRISLQGTFTTLYSFCPQPGCIDGAEPYGGLTQGADGNFYGTTNTGGAYNDGAVFKITPQGILTTLHSFNRMDGLGPSSAPIQATDGNFYGTTNRGGAYCFPMNGCGTIYKMTPNGRLTIIHSFDNTDGFLVSAPLVQAADGSFYGTAVNGGANNGGTVYRLDAFADLSVLKSGIGTVSSADGHIYCGTMCSYLYDMEDAVTLSAMPSPGDTFSGWEGCDNVNGSYCSVTMTSAKSVTARFASANVALTSLTFKPGYVKGGQLSVGTLTLSAQVPPGGLTVGLSSNHPAVAHPPSFVFVPEGKSSVQFAVQTFPVKSNTTVTITATAGSSHVGGTLMVGTTFLPPALK